MAKLYYILNNRPSQRSELALWWCPDCRGYTHDIDKAGVYTEEEAAGLVRNRPHEDSAIEVSLVLAAARRHVTCEAALPLPRLQVAKDNA